MAIASGIYFISWIQSVSSFLWWILIYSFIGYFIHLIWAWTRGKHRKNYLEFFVVFIYKLSIYFSIALILIGYFIIHQIYLFPAQMPQHTLTNGDRTVIFQTMSHVASPNFYTWVQKSISKAKKNGFVLFFEGVKPWTPENKEAFDEALWINLSGDSYEILAHLYGLEAQDNNSFLWIENNKDYNIDLNLDEIMNIYSKIPQEQVTLSWSGEVSPSVYDVSEELLKSLSSLSKREVMLMRYFNQSLMNFMIKHPKVQETMLTLLKKEDIFTVILDDRNKHLVQNISLSKEKDIFVIYGLMHFDWVFKMLQELDSNWKIIKTDYFQVVFPASITT